MQLNFFSAPRVSLLALTVVGGTLGLSPITAGDLSDFKSPLDNSPMTFPLQIGEVETPAVKNFKATDVNEYRGNADAVADSSMAAPAVRCSRSSATACSRTRCSGLSPM
jgi:cytochrome c-L